MSSSNGSSYPKDVRFGGSGGYMEGFESPGTRRHWKDVESGGYHESVDPFDIVSTKSASLDRLRRWRQAALVLNASRRFRYTLDFVKEEEKKQSIARIRAHAQAIRAAYFFQAAGNRPDGTPKASPSPIPADNILASSSSSLSLELSFGNSGSSMVSRPNREVPPAHMWTAIFGLPVSMEMEYWSQPLSRQHPMRWHSYISMANSGPSIVSRPNREVHPAHMRFFNHEKMLHFLYAVAIMVMYPALTQLIQLKFQNQPSPFETHGFFAHTSAVTYVIALMALMILASMKAYIFVRGHCTPAAYYVYMIVKTVCWLSVILAPLSLVLVLLIPQRLMWLGYSIQLLVSVTIVACNLSDIAKRLYKDGMSKLGLVWADLAQRHSGPSILGIASLVQVTLY